MTNDHRTFLENTALRVRSHVLRMTAGGGCYAGAALSCADILVYLYGSGALEIRPSLLTDPKRDYVLLSKGHAVPALYGAFAELGFLDRHRLENHLSTQDSIYWHPNPSIPGVEFYSGSLGHLLSVGAGIALGCRIDGRENKIVVVVGDGELNEGSMWEAMLSAAAKNLSNLIMIIDRNEYQANARTEDVTPLEPLETKLASFGWGVETVNGHSFDDLDDVFGKLPLRRGAPSAIIAQTVRGKGVPSIEARSDTWFVQSTSEGIDTMINELYGSRKGLRLVEGPDLLERS